MKKIIYTLIVILLLLVKNISLACDCPQCKNTENATTISRISEKDLKEATKIIKKLNTQTKKQIEEGYGPFLAAIYDKNGNLIAQMPNTVLIDQCSLNHAEINTIREAQKKLGTYDLSKYDLSIYINAEPCIMCAGAIMWSGIKHVYYSVSSKDVEEITGFDEGYKPDWIAQFKKRGIDVYGNIDTEEGKAALSKYIKSGKMIYKPSRD